MHEIFKAFSAVLGGIAGFLWGDLDGLLIALITFICLDYITGIVVGAAQHRLNSPSFVLPPAAFTSRMKD